LFISTSRIPERTPKAQVGQTGLSSSSSSIVIVVVIISSRIRTCFRGERRLVNSSYLYSAGRVYSVSPPINLASTFEELFAPKAAAAEKVMSDI